MKMLATCCPGLRKAVMGHSMRVDCDSCKVTDLHGTEQKRCPFCRRAFEWKGAQ